MRNNTSFTTAGFTGKRPVPGATPLRARRALWLLAFALCVLLLQSHQASAVAIGVNRAGISFTDVLRGGYAEEIIYITTDSTEMIGAEVILTGEAAEWINFSAREFNFSADRPYELHVIVQPPMDAQIENYSVDMSIITSEIARSDGGKIGTSTRASFRVPIAILMSGTERISCTVGGVQVLDTEEGQPIEVRLSVINRGNVRINPDIEIEIYDSVRSRTVSARKTDFGSRVLPTVTQNAQRMLEFDLEPAQYWAAVKVPLCGYTGLYTFDVLEPGGIKDDGDFIRIDAQGWAKTGDVVPIKAIFRNKGVRGVRAVFKGTISRVDDGQIAKVITTDEYVVGPDQTAELETFFNPQVGGQYMISGKVYYNNKLTAERNTILNVNGSPVDQRSGTGTALIIIAIVAVVLVLLILIKRKRMGR